MAKVESSQSIHILMVDLKATEFSETGGATQTKQKHPRYFWSLGL